jgi:large subunit ribosomal protein L35
MKKYKMKTKKSASKRIKLTSTGKVKRYSAGKRHLLEHKSPGSKRLKRGTTTVSKSDMKKIKVMLPGV